MSTNMLQNSQFLVCEAFAEGTPIEVSTAMELAIESIDTALEKLQAVLPMSRNGSRLFQVPKCRSDLQSDSPNAIGTYSLEPDIAGQLPLHVMIDYPYGAV